MGDSAAPLAKICGYLPLALRIAASTLAEHADLPVAEYRARLDDKRTRVSRRKRDSKPDQDLDAIFRYTYDQLAPDAPTHKRSLAVLSASFDLAAAADLWAIEQDAARTQIGEFVRASLVEFNPDRKRYVMPTLSPDELPKPTRLFRNTCKAATTPAHVQQPSPCCPASVSLRRLQTDAYSCINPCTGWETR